MTLMTRPDFTDSPYFVGEPGNWYLLHGAPPKVVKEFEAFMAVLHQFDEAPEPP